MNYKMLFKTTQFVKNIKEKYNFLRIGKYMHYVFNRFDKGQYAIGIRTGVTTLDSKIVMEITNFLNENKLTWFIAAGTNEIVIHVQ